MKIKKMKKKKNTIFLGGILSASLVGAIVACKGSSDSSSDKAATSADSSSSEEITATSLDQLNVPGLLAITLPASIKGTATKAGLALAEQKSYEACKMRGEIKEALGNIAQASNMICQIQKTPGLAFGKKYNIKFPDMNGDIETASTGTGATSGAGTSSGTATDLSFGTGTGTSIDVSSNSSQLPPMGLHLANSGLPETMQIWIDNSQTNKLRVFICQDKKLSQLIEFEGAGDKKAKGRLIMKQSMEMGDFKTDFHRTMNFDSNFTKAKETTIMIKELISFSSTAFGTQSGRRFLALQMPDEGVSHVSTSYSGTMGKDETKFAGFGAFGSDFGSLLSKGKFGDGDDFSTESFFDGQSYVVDPAQHSAAFGENGTVKVKSSSVPAFLSTSFKPDDFAADDWDCSGTEDLDISAVMSESSSSSGTECGDWAELTDEKCDDPQFAQGEAFEIKESEQVNPEKLEEFEPLGTEVATETETETETTTTSDTATETSTSVSLGITK